MSTQLSADDAKVSLSIHAANTGELIHARYGPAIGWKELLRLLQDRACVRYPCEIVFDAGHLQPGECAHPVPQGDRPEDGFSLCVHPIFMAQLDAVPALVLYQLVLINYGEFASTDDAEAFGSAALGLSRDEYYDVLCAHHDALDGGAGACPSCP